MVKEGFSKKIWQDPDTVLMVRPACFGFNIHTAKTNVFQKKEGILNAEEVAQKAIEEFDGLLANLKSHGVGVVVVQDNLDHYTPDAVFPNNWVSFHEDGSVILYPMLAPERRLERSLDIFQYLNKNFKYKDKLIDFHNFEDENKFLEGTGSIVLDRVHKVGFASLSQRTDLDVLEAFAQKTGYSLWSFDATDSNGVPFYHTNVILSICESFAVVCLDAVKNKNEKEALKEQLEKLGKELISISFEQVTKFCGNVFGLRNNEGDQLLAMSSSAFNGFTSMQKSKIQQYATIIHTPVPTIEKVGGGSVRCMLAGVHLPKITENVKVS